MSNLDKEIKFLPVNIAIVSISDTRSLREDFSGDFLSERIKGSGHHLIERHMVKDNKKEIKNNTSRIYVLCIDWKSFFQKLRQ